MPDPLSISRVETHDRLGVQIVALARSTVPVVARRAHGQIQEAAKLVEAHRRPDVRVPDVAPRFVRPRRRRRVSPIARHGAEVPNAFARSDVERLDIARRIVRVNQLVGDAVADDYEIAPYNGRRRLRVV